MNDGKDSGNEVFYIVYPIAMGDIFDFVDLTGAFDERLARYYFKQFINGLSICHDNGITHRDIKPENLGIDKGLHLRIADFGFAGPIKGRDENG